MQPGPGHLLDLFSVVPSSNPNRLPPAFWDDTFMLYLHYLFQNYRTGVPVNLAG